MEQFSSAFERAQTILKYLRNELNDEELDELNAWASASVENRKLLEGLTNEKKIQEGLLFLNGVEHEKAWEQVKKKIGREDQVKQVKISYKRRLMPLISVAAVLLLVFGSVMAYRLLLSKPSLRDIAQTKSSYYNDVPPGKDRAVLILEDGSTVVLDSVSKGMVIQQGGAQVVTAGGKLTYTARKGATVSNIQCNKVVTPTGGQFQVALPDGTLVWLNASSSLRYPTAFNGKQRRVEMTGEGYFEIAKNTAMPFVVAVNGSELQVLGTHFNVMAYQEESAVKTTLLEGSVKVVSGGNAALLKPGQQSQLNKFGLLRVVDDVNVESVTAWKNGMFHFDGQDLPTVMRQLSRWYDVKVLFEGQEHNCLFYAKIPRNSNLIDILKVLELTGNIKFKVLGNNITVL